MAERTIKHRLFTWFEEMDSPIQPGQKVLVERIAHLGETVDVTNEVHLKRGEDLDAFFTEEEAQAIEEGTFRGPTADAVYRSRAGVMPARIVEDIDDEGPQTGTSEDGSFNLEDASADETADHIRERRLGIRATLALLPHDADAEQIQKLYDAEVQATDSKPRDGVTRQLDARLAAATSQ